MCTCAYESPGLQPVCVGLQPEHGLQLGLPLGLQRRGAHRALALPVRPARRIVEGHAAHPPLRRRGGAGVRQQRQHAARVGGGGVARRDEDPEDDAAHGGAVATLCEAHLVRVRARASVSVRV